MSHTRPLPNSRGPIRPQPRNDARNAGRDSFARVATVFARGKPRTAIRGGDDRLGDGPLTRRARQPMSEKSGMSKGPSSSNVGPGGGYGFAATSLERIAFWLTELAHLVV